MLDRIHERRWSEFSVKLTAMGWPFPRFMREYHAGFSIVPGLWYLVRLEWR